MSTTRSSPKAAATPSSTGKARARAPGRRWVSTTTHTIGQDDGHQQRVAGQLQRATVTAMAHTIQVTACRGLRTGATSCGL